MPIDKVDVFKKNIAHIPQDELVNWTKHTVAKNENLIIIARKHRTQVTLIKELNHLKTNKVKEGETILIPKISHFPSHLISKINKSKFMDRSTSSIHTKLIHIVQPGDNYTILKRRYGVSPAEIRYWNQIKSLRKLQPGEQLVIWKKAISKKRYRVKKGDSLSRLAKRYNTSISRLRRANPSLKSDMLRIGQRINIA